MTARCLVIVRAGDQSLHPQWTSDASSRKWDLVVSYFGSDSARSRGTDEHRIDDKGQKYQGLHALLTREELWRAYDYIWLPDDDLATEQSSIDGLFATVARYDLKLAQPALSWTSHFSHPITLQHPNFRLRMTNFVEIMAPCFHRPFLEACVSTFTENLSGWGLDLLWPRMLAPEMRGCAVVDEVTVTHTRPVGGPAYDKLRAAGVTPHAELEALMRSFGICYDARPHVLAAIERDGTPLEQGDPVSGSCWCATARPSTHSVDRTVANSAKALRLIHLGCSTRDSSSDGVNEGGSCSSGKTELVTLVVSCEC